MTPKTPNPQNVSVIAAQTRVWYTVRGRDVRYEGRIVSGPFLHACDGQAVPQPCYYVQPIHGKKFAPHVIPAARLQPRGERGEIPLRGFKIGQPVKYRAGYNKGGQVRKDGVIRKGPLNNQAGHRSWEVERPDGTLATIREAMIL